MPHRRSTRSARRCAALVADLGVVFRAVGERRDLIARLITAAQRSATLVATENRALAGGLRELPATLGQVRTTTAHLARVGRRAGPVLDDLTLSLRRLRPAIDDLPRTADTTRGALRALSAATPTARSLLTALRRAGGPTAALVPALDSVMRDLRPTLAHLAPYSKEAGVFCATLGQAATSTDAVGHLARSNRSLARQPCRSSVNQNARRSKRSWASARHACSTSAARTSIPSRGRR